MITFRKVTIAGQVAAAAVAVGIIGYEIYTTRKNAKIKKEIHLRIDRILSRHMEPSQLTKCRSKFQAINVIASLRMALISIKFSSFDYDGAAYEALFMATINDPVYEGLDLS